MIETGMTVSTVTEKEPLPLKGTICCRTGEPSRFDTCLTCAKYGEPDACAFPLPLIATMAANQGSRDGAGLSATTLIGCPRFEKLARAHDYYEDPEDYYPRFHGTSLHAGLEYALAGQEDVISEERFYRDVVDDDWIVDPATGEIIEKSNTVLATLSGKPDIVLPKWKGIGKIYDGKRAGRRRIYPGMDPRPEHVQQLNIYRWILAKGRPQHPTTDEGGVQTYEIVNIPIGEASIIYIGDQGMVEVPVEIMPLDEVERMVVELVRHRDAQAIPPVLPHRKVRNRNTGVVTMERHWKCGYCPLQDVCYNDYPLEGIPWEEVIERDS